MMFNQINLTKCKLPLFCRTLAARIKSKTPEPVYFTTFPLQIYTENGINQIFG